MTSIAEAVKKASSEAAAKSREYLESVKAAGGGPVIAGKQLDSHSVATMIGSVPTPGQKSDEKKVPSFKAVGVEHGVIIGIGASIGVDKEQETVQKGALIGMAYDFCASKAREFWANHDEKATVDAELVCSWPGTPILKSGVILEAGKAVPENDPIVAIGIEKGSESHWFVGVRPTGDTAETVLKAARDGELVGFSWGGMALKVAE